MTARHHRVEANYTLTLEMIACSFRVLLTNLLDVHLCGGQPELVLVAVSPALHMFFTCPLGRRWWPRCRCNTVHCSRVVGLLSGIQGSEGLCQRVHKGMRIRRFHCGHSNRSLRQEHQGTQVRSCRSQAGLWAVCLCGYELGVRCLEIRFWLPEPTVDVRAVTASQSM